MLRGRKGVSCVGRVPGLSASLCSYCLGLEMRSIFHSRHNENSQPVTCVSMVVLLLFNITLCMFAHPRSMASPDTYPGIHPKCRCSYRNLHGPCPKPSLPCLSVNVSSLIDTAKAGGFLVGSGTYDVL